MLMFTNEHCLRLPRGKASALLPFKPGELYLVRYMSGPTVMTVQSVKDDMVTTWGATETFEQFNARIICRLGQRPCVLGVFLPWVQIAPVRHLHLDVTDALGTDDTFWKVTRA